MSKCPRCSRSIQRDAQICLKCGADLKPSKTFWFLLVGTLALSGVTTWMSAFR